MGNRTEFFFAVPLARFLRRFLMRQAILGTSSCANVRAATAGVAVAAFHPPSVRDQNRTTLKLSLVRKCNRLCFPQSEPPLEGHPKCGQFTDLGSIYRPKRTSLRPILNQV